MQFEYDAVDALLHHIYKQTQGDSWYKSSSDTSVAGVCLRVGAYEFCVYPQDDRLADFECAVAHLNPEVAVKVRSAAVHAALARTPRDASVLFLDEENRIQILRTMSELAKAEKGQGAAFIRDEDILVVWSDRVDDIIDEVQKFDKRLLSLVWKARPLAPMTPDSHSLASGASSIRSVTIGTMPSRSSSLRHVLTMGEKTGDPEASLEMDVQVSEKDVSVDELESGEMPENTRPVRLLAPIYNGLAVACSLYFVGASFKKLLVAYSLDGSTARFGLIVTMPFLFCISLFFSITLISSVMYSIGPVAQYHQNSKYYSGVAPLAPRGKETLPHITIQMPVYTESLEHTITPTVDSLQRAMLTYARQGGTSSIFINDDGMQIVSMEDRIARQAFYENRGIGWVARPKNGKDGFVRAGRFKKASNMNFCLAVALRMEEVLIDLVERAEGTAPPTRFAAALPAQPPVATPSIEVAGKARRGFPFSALAPSFSRLSRPATPSTDVASKLRAAFPGIVAAAAHVAPRLSITEQLAQLQPDELDDETRLAERALEIACAETGGVAWGRGGKAMKMGSIILIVDSDTQVPEDCLRDAARELNECPEVAILQHISDAMQVAHHYFENAIAYFTRRTNQTISISCANGEVAPFVGHNAFMRWEAVQEAAFVDPADGKRKFWSEAHVSEDFDLALRLQLQGYTIRWATYSKGGFKEGVSLTCDDELNRWQKYAYGVSELLFHPLHRWLTKGPITPLFHMFAWSPIPIHYKISVMAYMFSYYGIASAITLSLVNYFLLGFALHASDFYFRSWELFIACSTVFLGIGTVGFSLLEYRLNQKGLIASFALNLKWLPFFFFFFGGMSLHLAGAMIAHLTGYNITWSSTVKEVEASNFFKEVPKILRRFWGTFIACLSILIMIVVLALPFIPRAYSITWANWAVIFPIALQAGCHILYPILLNPWFMIFSY